MRRTVRAECNHPGCKEWGFYETNNEEERKSARESAKKYLCSRHRHPEELLSLGNLKTEKVYTANENAELKKLFWGGVSGFVFGDGYKAYADDFPPGTKLIVTAKIVLPD